ncbi:MAG: helix-turn-helix transcriptional regulator [Legionellales bacterium]
MPNLLPRLIRMTVDIEKICQPLRKYGICWFSHDITFGKGEISILTNQEENLRFYYQHAFPAVCTTDEGRVLPVGIYLTHNLIPYEGFSQIHSVITKQFKYTYGIHFVEKEDNCQHVYSFAYDLNESNFLYRVINDIVRLQRFISDYKNQAQAIIEQAAQPKNRIILPYSNSVDSKITELSSHLETLLPFNQLDFNTIFSMTDDDLTYFLVKRSYSIWLYNRQLSLSKMEIRTLIQLLKGSHAGQISQTLGIKQTTVESYLTNIRNKFSVNNRYELIQLITSEKILQQIIL